MITTTQQDKTISNLTEYHGISESDSACVIETLNNGFINLRIACFNDLYGYGLEVHNYTIDTKGHLHSIGDNAAHTAYRTDIENLTQYNTHDSEHLVLEVHEIDYCKNNKSHRLKNLFSHMYYDQDLNEYIYDYSVNGKLHRTNGPARECSSFKEYYLNDVKLTKEDVRIHNFMNKKKHDVQ